MFDEFNEAIYDLRFEASLFWHEDFLPYMVKNILISNQITITPRFLNHFDLYGISDYRILLYCVLYIAIQLGF